MCRRRKLSATVSVDHKRPWLAFILVALICGMVIGHTLATAAVPALWKRPVAIVQGIVFQALPAEPTDGVVFSPVAAADPVTVVPAVDLRAVHQGATTHTRHTMSSPRVARGTHQVRWQQARWARWSSGFRHGRHAHGKHLGHGQSRGHGQPDFVLSLRWR